MERVSPVQLTLSIERSRHDCAVAKNSNADRISALCFTAYPRTGVLRSSDDTLCHFARGLSPQRGWEHAPCVRVAKPCFPCSLTCAKRISSLNSIPIEHRKNDVRSAGGLPGDALNTKENEFEPKGLWR